MAIVTSYGDISPAVAAWSVVKMLERAIPFLHFEKFCQTYPLPTNSTQTAKFRRYYLSGSTGAAGPDNGAGTNGAGSAFFTVLATTPARGGCHAVWLAHGEPGLHSHAATVRRLHHCHRCDRGHAHRSGARAGDLDPWRTGGADGRDLALQCSEGRHQRLVREPCRGADECHHGHHARGSASGHHWSQSPERQEDFRSGCVHGGVQHQVGGGVPTWPCATPTWRATSAT